MHTYRMSCPIHSIVHDLRYAPCFLMQNQLEICTFPAVMPEQGQVVDQEHTKVLLLLITLTCQCTSLGCNLLSTVSVQVN